MSSFFFLRVTGERGDIPLCERFSKHHWLSVCQRPGQLHLLNLSPVDHRRRRTLRCLRQHHLQVEGGTDAPLFGIRRQLSSQEWSKGLSPFFLGPVPLWDGMVATNVENAWQYCKGARVLCPSPNWCVRRVTSWVMRVSIGCLSQCITALLHV